MVSKKCQSCGAELPRSSFSKTQWSKMAGATCVTCLKTAQTTHSKADGSASEAGRNSGHKTCTVCLQVYPKSAFPADQWERSAGRRCFNCANAYPNPFAVQANPQVYIPNGMPQAVDNQIAVSRVGTPYLQDPNLAPKVAGGAPRISPVTGAPYSAAATGGAYPTTQNYARERMEYAGLAAAQQAPPTTLPPVMQILQALSGQGPAAEQQYQGTIATPQCRHAECGHPSIAPYYFCHLHLCPACRGDKKSAWAYCGVGSCLKAGPQVVQSELTGYAYEQPQDAAIGAQTVMAYSETGKAMAPNWYFEHYSKVGVHELMLKDACRTTAYRNAIMNNKHLFEGKVVVDVGCGTGILSVFAAQAGAKKVFGIDASGMAVCAREVAAENGFADVITILHMRVEDAMAQGLKDSHGEVFEQVDVIVSEWMGYFLLCESMLDTVIRARERWLKPGGHVFPTHCAMFVSPFEDLNGARFWDDVYGLSMKTVRPYSQGRCFDSKYPLYEIMPARCNLGPGACVKFVNCNTATVEEVSEFSTDEFTLALQRSGALNGFCGYFTVYFDGSPRDAPAKTQEELHNDPTVVRLDTTPTDTKDTDTHWMHSLFLASDDVMVKAGDQIKAKVRLTSNLDEARYKDVTIEWSVNGQPTQRRMWLGR
eukprot:NODE_80_length_2232_cov_220.276225_g59_i0.p1 GENE.NODE_80_length_2232_cov_220.276225_g59_i0~~NODE_80_length_2232_cov_220.276225_g59_i0.p1  ORF type:complete len:651 (-),score=188.84 NODE_80_length_2232_cov_220.276225_g59_i0:214-2166(-)